MGVRIVEIRNIKIGEGSPKICVPVAEQTKEEILEAAKDIVNSSADMVEWRADWYEGIFDFEKTIQTGQELRKILGDIPLLFTFRTAKEGGEKEISKTEYKELNLEVIHSKFADLIDVEALLDEEIAKDLITAAHKNGVYVIASNHDFQKTPPKSEIVRRLKFMQALNADIPKIAVMPQNRQDVLELLSATLEMSEHYADRPLITMSMGSDGVISRFAGEVFGSALTFGFAGKASAPGQIAAQQLHQILQILHDTTE